MLSSSILGSMCVGLPLVLPKESMTMPSSTSLRDGSSEGPSLVKPIINVGFQLVQEKIVRIMATVQAIMLYCFRVSQLVDEGKATMGQIATCKAWVSLQLREVAKLGR